uniref:Uncharacterized protein n=1 Tax=Panagrolaimus sp. ES5 TaxID=591445 RepID=A0AC34FPR0_9BILA
MEDKNYRKVKEDKYFCGYNSKGKHESLLVVYESNDQKLAREYEKISQQWRCIGCKAFKEKVTIKIQNGGEIYAPLQHSCTPRNLDTIIVEQKRYRNIALFGDGKTFSTHSTVYENSQRFEKFGEDEYEFGVNGVRRPDSCIIVQHKTDKNLVYHYYTENKKWYCCKCYATSKDRKYGIFINNFLYLPKYHICTPIPREESMQEQAALLSDDSKADVLFIKYEKYLQIINECDYTYGVTPRFKKLNQQKLLIVCDSKYRNDVREYFYKIPSVWQCISCCLKKKYDTFAILKNGKISYNQRSRTIDMIHQQVWEPNITNVSHIVSNPGVQRRFPRSRTSTAPIPSVSTKLSVSAARKRGRPRKNPLPRSNSTSSLSDSSHSSLMELRYNFFKNQSLELWPTSDNENGTSKNDNSQDIIKEKEPLALLENYVELYEEDYRNATQTTFNTTVDFNASDSEIHQKEVIDYHLFKPLTNSIHKSILEKLAIPLDETDVSFLEVKIDSIKPNSVPAEIMEISTQKDSFFRSLSCFFTGKEKNWEDVKWGIRKYFFDNYKTFGEQF